VLNKFLSAVMAAFYVALGAICFLIIPNPIVASCFFAVGILLVINFHNFLLTRVVPLSVYSKDKDYNALDIFITILGNIAGSGIAGILISLTRSANAISDKLNTVVNARLNDNYLSIFILAILCGMMVAYSCLAVKKHGNNSFAGIFYCWLFISAFVFCGYEHVVADVFFFVTYSVLFEFKLSLLLILLIVLIGNMIGGFLSGFLEKKRS